jgi:hypothetical protein
MFSGSEVVVPGMSQMIECKNGLAGVVIGEDQRVARRRRPAGPGQRRRVFAPRHECASGITPPSVTVALVSVNATVGASGDAPSIHPRIDREPRRSPPGVSTVAPSSAAASIAVVVSSPPHAASVTARGISSAVRIALASHPAPSYQLSLVQRRARRRAFRERVLAAYDRACSLCGVRIQWGGLIEAEAAHIKPHELRGADDVRNALALCRTHHWSFDRGLWTASPDLVIDVQTHAPGTTADLRALHDLRGRRLRAPRPATAAPHPLALAWHRDNPFRDARGGAGG